MVLFVTVLSIDIRRMEVCEDNCFLFYETSVALLEVSCKCKLCVVKAMTTIRTGKTCAQQSLFCDYPIFAFYSVYQARLI